MVPVNCGSDCALCAVQHCTCREILTPVCTRTALHRTTHAHVCSDCSLTGFHKKQKERVCQTPLPHKVRCYLIPPRHAAPQLSCGVACVIVRHHVLFVSIHVVLNSVPACASANDGRSDSPLRQSETQACVWLHAESQTQADQGRRRSAGVVQRTPGGQPSLRRLQCMYVYCVHSCAARCTPTACVALLLLDEAVSTSMAVQLAICPFSPIATIRASSPYGCCVEQP